MQLPRLGESDLFGISGTSLTDVWAVGRVNSGELHPLTLHYDGNRWQVLDSFPAMDQAGLESVSAISADDVWAACWCECEDGVRGLLLHWDGQQWVDSHAAAVHDDPLYGVSAVGADDAWAVGAALVGAAGADGGSALRRQHLAGRASPQPRGRVTTGCSRFPRSRIRTSGRRVSGALRRGSASAACRPTPPSRCTYVAAR